MAAARATQAVLLLPAGGGDIAATQAVLLVPAGGGDITSTQSAALVLGSIPTASIRSTQAAALVAAGVLGEGMRDTQSGLLVLAHYVPCLTRWAQCWRIERRDGEVFRFTSHDQPVSFRGEEYQPRQSLSASASELGTVLGSAGDVELAGIIADDAITERDLYAGLFDRAQVEVWMVPWSAGSGEAYRLTAGVTGDLQQGVAGFQMQVQTPGGLLTQQPLLEAYTPACRWELGDARCGIDLDALAVTGAVTTIAERNAFSRAHHRVFWDSARAEADGYFDLGVLIWTSGENIGLRAEIKSYSLTNGGQFVLWQPSKYPIALGDQYEARPGCDKASETCKIKFSNYANFGGFPDVPGDDAISQTPNAKS